MVDYKLLSLGMIALSLSIYAYISAPPDNNITEGDMHTSPSSHPCPYADVLGLQTDSSTLDTKHTLPTGHPDIASLSNKADTEAVTKVEPASTTITSSPSATISNTPSTSPTPSSSAPTVPSSSTPPSTPAPAAATEPNSKSSLPSGHPDISAYGEGVGCPLGFDRPGMMGRF